MGNVWHNLQMHKSNKTLTLGQKNFPSILVQGPLAGYSCAPMRVQTWRQSTPGYCSTEMASAAHLVHARQQPKRFTYRHPDEGPLCFQLSGYDPEVLAKATRYVDSLGVELIELNCGCPVNKIRSKGAGSKLLSQPELLRQLVRAMRANTSAVLSIKIRVAGDQQDQDDEAIARVVEEEGADMLVVHGRHWTERYDVDCRFDAIQQFVERVDIPVVGNGDVSDVASLKRMLQTGCAGVMIGRASVGQPWLFNQLIAELQGESFSPPPTDEVGHLFIDHIEQLAALDSPYRAALQARTMGKYYARDRLDDKVGFIERLNQCVDLDEFRSLVSRYFV